MGGQIASCVALRGGHGWLTGGLDTALHHPEKRTKLVEMVSGSALLPPEGRTELVEGGLASALYPPEGRTGVVNGRFG